MGSQIKFKHFITEQFYNEKLNPKFWTLENDTYVFDERIANKLVEIANDLSIRSEVDMYVQDIVLTGSMANYNYTKFSDLDVHILLDFDDVGSDRELVKSALDGKRFKWNNDHNINIRGHNIELYFEDTNENHVSSGIYSLLNGEWVKEPSIQQPDIDESEVIFRFNQIQRDIQLIKKYYLQSKNNKKTSRIVHNIASNYKDKIMNMRKDSLGEDGEFGEGNIVFKKLRDSNNIKLLIDIINKTYDNIYSEQLDFKKFRSLYA